LSNCNYSRANQENQKEGRKSKSRKKRKRRGGRNKVREGDSRGMEYTFTGGSRRSERPSLVWP
jgi:hypothetical protein